MFGQFSIKILGKRDIEQCCVYKLQLSMEDEVCDTYVRTYICTYGLMYLTTYAHTVMSDICTYICTYHENKHTNSHNTTYGRYVESCIYAYVSRLVILSLKIKGTDWSTFAMYWGTTLTLLVMYPGF